EAAAIEMPAIPAQATPAFTPIARTLEVQRQSALPAFRQKPLVEPAPLKATGSLADRKKLPTYNNILFADSLLLKNFNSDIHKTHEQFETGEKYFHSPALTSNSLIQKPLRLLPNQAPIQLLQNRIIIPATQVLTLRDIWRQNTLSIQSGLLLENKNQSIMPSTLQEITQKVPLKYSLVTFTQPETIIEKIVMLSQQIKEKKRLVGTRRILKTTTAGARRAPRTAIIIAPIPMYIESHNQTESAHILPLPIEENPLLLRKMFTQICLEPAFTRINRKILSGLIRREATDATTETTGWLRMIEAIILKDRYGAGLR
ncbi:MAG: hypothetical protein ABH865_01320, partial [Candidatus Omnitrophota bacterium]